VVADWCLNIINLEGKNLDKVTEIQKNNFLLIFPGSPSFKVTNGAYTPVPHISESF
jgi:hypothetical protein